MSRRKPHSSSQADAQNTPSAQDMLRQHSADWLIFARYVEHIAPHVRLKLSDTEHACDIYAVHVNGAGAVSYQFMRLVPHAQGIPSGSSAFYGQIHALFRQAKPSDTYLGFRGCGRHMVSPLMHVAHLYTTFGRGLIQNGHTLPTPCRVLEQRHGIGIRSFRTTAPLK